MELTATEYALLYELAVHAPRFLSHNVLLQRVWGAERVGESWLVRDVVKRLRRKLGDDAASPTYILTEPRVGYRMGRVRCRNGKRRSGQYLARRRFRYRAGHQIGQAKPSSARTPIQIQSVA